MFNTSYLSSVATKLSLRLDKTNKPLALYYDNTEFRISPADGKWVNNVLTSFPDSIVGVYSNTVSFKEIMDDLKWFCNEMGQNNTY